MNQFRKTNVTRIIILSALFVALAVVTRFFGTMIQLYGIPGMRISFSPVFARMPAILFGPFYGGIAGGLTDVIAFLLKPEGPYIPFLTMTQILDGILVGFLWNFIKKHDTIKIQKALWVIFTSLGVLGILNYINTLFFPQSPITKVINAIGKKKDFFVAGLIAIAFVGILLLLLDMAIGKKFPEAKIHKYRLKVLFAFGLAGIIVTTINTYILKIAFSIKADFVYFWIPRLVEEVFMAVIWSFVVAFLLTIYDRAVPSKAE